MFFRQFGGKVTRELRERYAQSPQYVSGQFRNLEATSLADDVRKIPGIIYRQLTSRIAQEPPRPLDVLPFDAEAFLLPTDHGKFIWYGHSAVLLRLGGKTLLIDPMLGPNTTPIAPMATRRFSEGTLELLDQFPPIDAVLITHDHYDHLDLASILKLIPKVDRYYVALGVGRHLEHWGVAADRITEFDWWQTARLGSVEITFTPTRHFSGRGLTDRMQTLWGGWALRTSSENIWFSGDGGYGSHFKEVGQRLGPFDLAFMECGQYNVDWPQLHLFPEEAVRAAQDAQVRRAVPVHWAGFALSYQHTWRQPADDFVRAAQDAGQDIVLPEIGQLFTVQSSLKDAWWTRYDRT